MKKFLTAAIPVALGVILPAAAFAQELSTTTAASEVTTFIGSVAAVIGAVIAGILALLAALIGLRWGVSRFQRWVGGRKF